MHGIQFSLVLQKSYGAWSPDQDIWCQNPALHTLIKTCSSFELIETDTNAKISIERKVSEHICMEFGCKTTIFCKYFFTGVIYLGVNSGSPHAGPSHAAAGWAAQSWETIMGRCDYPGSASLGLLGVACNAVFHANVWFCLMYPGKFRAVTM